MNSQTKTAKERFNFNDFTYENYRSLLKLAKENFEFTTYESSYSQDSILVLRHDIDFALQKSVELARIENSENVTSTYFIHLHNNIYNWMSSESLACFEEITDLGHHLGLHFDPVAAEVQSLVQCAKKINRERSLLAEYVDYEVNAFSFHNPTTFNEKFLAVNIDGMVNTYSELFQDEFLYCSDSNGYWRHESLEDMLQDSKGEKLQVLTHPVWWSEDVMSPEQRYLSTLEGKKERTLKNYQEFLESSGRNLISEGFEN